MADLEFEGESFDLADKVGLMPLMRFAHVARGGVDAADMEGLAAIYDLLQNVIADGDWARFERHATKVRASGDDLMGVVKQAIKVISDRPTSEPSGSSDGPPSTSGSSADGSPSPVIAREISRNRVDRAEIVHLAQRSRASA